MGRTYTVGGDRLGNGNKLEVELHGWGKSTHNLDQKLKTTMSAGTLVPFIVEPILPGDELRMKLSIDAMTEPTNGSLFGSFKLQADVFIADTRLYNGKMHNNKLRVANRIEEIKLPLVRLKGRNLDLTKKLSNQHVNTSCLMSYLGVRGLGYQKSGATNLQRDFDALGLLMYWDIYKNYYASKQENIGVVIHSEPRLVNENVNSIVIETSSINSPFTLTENNNNPSTSGMAEPTMLTWEGATINFSGSQSYDNIILILSNGLTTKRVLWEKVFFENTENPTNITATALNTAELFTFKWIVGWSYADANELDIEPKLKTFDLENLDRMREFLLSNTLEANAIIIHEALGYSPYADLLKTTGTGTNIRTSLVNNQEGLAIKTYQSDQFNAWLKTDYIDAINNSSAIAIVGNTLYLDQINLSKKVYEHLNRLAVTAGTYRDYIAVSYDVAVRDIEIPIYIGGLSKEIVFAEVVSQAETSDKPLGTIGGKGMLNDKHKGGFVEYKAYDYGTLMGIMSITPRLDYTQGNKWWTNLKTLKDYHIPQMDGIGYQDLITDAMAYFDTEVDGTGNIITRSAGKQPAWMNYQTSHNRALGKFADELDWMVLGRDYEVNETNGRILDLTQYIDPKKYNRIFAQASRDAMNFWIEVSCELDIRRVMSAKQIPSF